MLLPILEVPHALLVELIPEKVQLCIGQVVLSPPTGLEALQQCRLVNCGDTVSVPFGESAKESVNDVGGLPVDAVFELEKNSGLGFVADLALGNAGASHDDILGAFVDSIQVPYLRFRGLGVWKVGDFRVRLKEHLGIGATLDHGGALVVEREYVLTGNASLLDGGQ
jgi:hypothetical protein